MTEKTRTCRYHCVFCELSGRPSCFTSLEAFDAHIGRDGQHIWHDSASACTWGKQERPLIPVPGECRLANNPGPTTLYTTAG